MIRIRSGEDYTIHYADGAQYVGQIKQSLDGGIVRDGKGRMEYVDNVVFEGTFVDDDRCGYGILVSADGMECYKLNWNEDQMDGIGSYSNEHLNLVIYDALWSKGVLINGTLRANNTNEVYKGHFNSNMLPHGNGMLLYGDGDMYEGLFENGVRS